jgi:hypothetical protein
MLDLLLTYGIAFICAFICSAIGLHAFFVNGSSYQNLFSTYFRATKDLNLRSQLVAGDKGADPLSKVLAQSLVAIGEHVDKSRQDPEQSRPESTLTPHRP